MEANELMVGDWVVYDGDVEYINPIQIEGMDIATDMLITSDRDDVGFKGVQPIPLTKEILWDNLPNTPDNPYWSKVYWEWDDEKSNEEENWYEFSISSKNIKVNMTIRYVHELQHALRLCGINKEIELLQEKKKLSRQQKPLRKKKDSALL